MEIRESLHSAIESAADLATDFCEDAYDCAKWLTLSVASIVVEPFLILCDFVEDRWEEYRESRSLNQRNVKVAPETRQPQPYTQVRQRPTEPAWQLTPRHRQQISLDAKMLLWAVVDKHQRAGALSDSDITVLLSSPQCLQQKVSPATFKRVQQDIISHLEHGTISARDAAIILDRDVSLIRLVYAQRPIPVREQRPQTPAPAINSAPVFKLL